MKARLDMNKIAKGLGAERRGKVSVGAGHFGAMQLAADIQTRLRVPTRGGRATDPAWTERRLIPMTSPTLKRIEELVQRLREEQNVSVEPMQLAAILLERTVESIEEQDEKDIAKFVGFSRVTR